MSKEIVSGKFTPGPWTNERGDITGIENDSANGCVGFVDVCSVYLRTVKGRQEANARLIASAPDLLDALEYARFAMRAPLDDWKGEVERAALDKAGAAIAKALGEIAP